MSRTPIIAGNWKLNKTIAQSLDFVNEVKDLVKDAKDVDVVLCATPTTLKDLKEATKGTNIEIAAQNVNQNESGAFTGELSVLALKELDINYCVIGHSERREYYNESDEDVNAKTKLLLANDITPLLCCGETLEVRQAGTTNEVVGAQLEKDLSGLSSEDLAKIVIAYEPIWAIGTGMTATSEQAQETIAALRAKIASLFDEAAAASVRIQYGGSVKPENVKEILSKEDIDGALVGGASLDADSFAKLVNFNK